MATVRYLVNEVDLSIEFYTTHLGFELVEQMGPAFALIAKIDRAEIAQRQIVVEAGWQFRFCFLN